MSADELSVPKDPGCSLCGCTGWHACIGRRLPPPTPEEEARISTALDKIFGAKPEPKPYVFTPVPGAVCSQELWAAGKGAPKTCQVHGLTGCGVPTA